MPETIIDSVLAGNLDHALVLKWLNNESLEETHEDCILNCCSRSEFVTCFLSYLRNQTDSILQTNNNAVQILQNSTPEKLLSTRRKHHRSISDPTTADRTTDSLSVKSDSHRSQESPSKDRKRTGRRVKTKLFTEDKSNHSISSDESRLSIGIDKIAISSTPMKNGMKPSDYPNLSLASPVTPKSFVKEQHERCDTPRLVHRHSRSQDKSCLGDFMVNVQKSSKKKKSGRSSTDNDDSKPELDLTSSEMFPEIGTRKSSSLRSEKRRIKPTNIDKSQKSISLNSFSADSIHTSPLPVEENSAFRQQKIQIKESNNFDAERNILKQERHKLMEKFNILNTSMPQKAMVTPQIKVAQKIVEKLPNYIKTDTAKVVFKEKLDLLVEIYEALLRNNLIMSVNTEIYFLISIVISKQYEDDYKLVETKLNESDMGFLLKSIHNSTYFAVKSLWHQRVLLEVILEKSSLKTLGENKKVRSFYPDLAKFLLNCYGLRCEAESNSDRNQRPESQTNGIVAFNSETDNAENFPSMLSFQNFKKQRDMFYEILRWYSENQSAGPPRSSLRARVKALLCIGPSPTNHAHLAALFTLHIQHCLPTDKQESKLSKLQRRLTCPNAPESHRLPHFTSQEMFYKDFIINAENEMFRVHLRDAIASEITTLDATHINTEDRGNSNQEIIKEYLVLCKKLSLLAKFLGLLAALPYTQTMDVVNKSSIAKPINKETNYTPPKEKVLENDLAIRNYSQPSIDLKGILMNSIENSRLSITLPWLVHYLSMLDFTSLRTKYYQNLLKILFDIYTNRLKIDNNQLKRNTVIYLKSILGWLFDLPHFPHELFYENRLNTSVGNELSIDNCDLIDEMALIELCPHLKELNVLISTCRVSQDQKEMGSYRHITPVSLSLNPEDRIKNKEKEIQARLEEELLKSQPSSTRRVLELVIERITSACVRELNGHTLPEFRQKAAKQAAKLVSTSQLDQTALVSSVRALYERQLEALTAAALARGQAALASRASAAVTSLLLSAPAPLLALVLRAATTRLQRWLKHNWNTTDVFCKNIEAEVKTLMSLGEYVTSSPHVDVTAMTSAPHEFDSNHVSPATAIIQLKEQICLLLEGLNAPELCTALTMCTNACAPHNVFNRVHTQRAILQLSVDACIVVVSRIPSMVNEAMLSKLSDIWNICCADRRRRKTNTDTSPVSRNFHENPSSPDTYKPSKTLQTDEEDIDSSLEYFERILCPRNIMLLSDNKCLSVQKSVNKCNSWDAMATVLVFLLKNDYLSEDSLTEQCLAVYRQDWSQNVLENLSSCMKTVSVRWSSCSSGKFTLFLDFLSEFCGDMDFEPMD